MPSIYFNPNAPGQDVPGQYTSPGSGNKWIDIGLTIFNGVIDLFGHKPQNGDQFQPSGAAPPSEDNSYNLIGINGGTIALIAIAYILLNKR